MSWWADAARCTVANADDEEGELQAVFLFLHPALLPEFFLYIPW